MPTMEKTLPRFNRSSSSPVPKRMTFRHEDMVDFLLVDSSCLYDQSPMPGIQRIRSILGLRKGVVAERQRRDVIRLLPTSTGPS